MPRDTYEAETALLHFLLDWSRQHRLSRLERHYLLANALSLGLQNDLEDRHHEEGGSLGCAKQVKRDVRYAVGDDGCPENGGYHYGPFPTLEMAISIDPSEMDALGDPCIYEIDSAKGTDTPVYVWNSLHSQWNKCF